MAAPMTKTLDVYDRAALLQDGLRLHFLPDGPALALVSPRGPGPALVRGQTSPGWLISTTILGADGRPMLPVPEPVHGGIDPIVSRGPAVPATRRPDDDGPEGLAGLLAYFYASSSPHLAAGPIADEVTTVLTQAAGRSASIAPVAGDPLQFAVAFPETRRTARPRQRPRGQDVWI